MFYISIHVVFRLQIYLLQLHWFLRVECHGFESHLRQLICVRKSDCLGCAVLLCVVVCLTLLVSFFLPSHHLSLKHVCMHVLL